MDFLLKLQPSTLSMIFYPNPLDKVHQPKANSLIRHGDHTTKWSPREYYKCYSIIKKPITFRFPNLCTEESSTSEIQIVLHCLKINLPALESGESSSLRAIRAKSSPCLAKNVSPMGFAIGSRDSLNSNGVSMLNLKQMHS